MIRRFLRQIFHEELEELQVQIRAEWEERKDSVMIFTASAINENNAVLEKHFIELGLLERDAAGGLQARRCPAVDLMEKEQIQLEEQRNEDDS